MQVARGAAQRRRALAQAPATAAVLLGCAAFLPRPAGAALTSPVARLAAYWRRSAADPRERKVYMHCITDPTSTSAYQDLMPFTGDGGTSLPIEVSLAVQDSNTAAAREGAAERRAAPQAFNQSQILDAIYPLLFRRGITPGMVENATTTTLADNGNATKLSFWVRQPEPKAGSGMPATASLPSDSSFVQFKQQINDFVQQDLPAVQTALGAYRVFGLTSSAAQPPTVSPTSGAPTGSPTLSPTSPTTSPSTSPPTLSPTGPTGSPTRHPTAPTKSPSNSPTRNPTAPTTAPSTSPPTLPPTLSPTNPTTSPSSSPPTLPPTTGPPTGTPTKAPTRPPSTSPPSVSPTTMAPSRSPTPQSAPAAGRRRLLSQGTDVFGQGGPCCITNVQAQTTWSRAIVFRQGAALSSPGVPVLGRLGQPPGELNQLLVADTDRAGFGYSDMRKVWIANTGTVSLPQMGFADFNAAWNWATTTTGVTFTAQSALWNIPIVAGDFSLASAERTRTVFPGWVNGQLRNFADFGQGKATAGVLMRVTDPSGGTRTVLNSVQDLDTTATAASQLWYLHDYTMASGSAADIKGVDQVASNASWLVARPALLLNCPIDEIEDDLPEAPADPPVSALGPAYQAGTPAHISPIYLPNEVDQELGDNLVPAPLLYMILVPRNRYLQTYIYPAKLGQQVPKLREYIGEILYDINNIQVKVNSICWWNGNRGDHACPHNFNTTIDNVMLCQDRYTCNVATEGWDCCRAHQGRAQCPKNYPTMCAEPHKCQGDFCCSADENCTGLGGPKACAESAVPVLDHRRCNYCSAIRCDTTALAHSGRCRACLLDSCHGCVQHPFYGAGSKFMQASDSEESWAAAGYEYRIQNYETALALNGTDSLPVGGPATAPPTTTTPAPATPAPPGPAPQPTPAPTVLVPKPMVVQLRLFTSDGTDAETVAKAVRQFREAVRDAGLTGLGPLSSALAQFDPPLRIYPGTDLYEEEYHLAPNEAGTVLTAGSQLAPAAVVLALSLAASLLL